MWWQLVIGWCVGSPVVAVVIGKMIAAGARIHPAPVAPSGVVTFGSDARIPVAADVRSEGLPQAA